MPCNPDTLKEIFDRDLQKLETEINSYKDEAAIWQIADGITNCGGNLCLHICGGLQHFIGATLGETGYVRNRDAEFSLKGIPKEKLIAEISQTRNVIDQTLDKMNDDKLNQDFPINVLGKTNTTEFFLIHLISHLNYHLGQINYHRRMMK